ncbi:MAG: hypothetical protein JNG86_11020 [Verrucomicrobiaceae bacterium]|nr:hypothetical protein [Verrucomicrobiaceae bacterium]
MSLLPHFAGEKAMNRARRLFFMGLCIGVAVRGADVVQQAPPPVDDLAIPRSVNNDHFEALIMNSPFTRSLGVSDSLILTGVARIENEVFATLLDTKTMASHVVSKKANAQGWQLIGVGGNPAEIQTWTARIQVAGGEVVSVRYQKPPPRLAHTSSGKGGSSGGGSGGGNVPPLSSAQLDEAKSAALNYKEGFNADGYPRQPPPEMVAKLSRLSVGQREDINRTMFGFRNQGLGLDERRKIYENLVDRTIQGGR